MQSKYGTLEIVKTFKPARPIDRADFDSRTITITNRQGPPPLDLDADHAMWDLRSIELKRITLRAFVPFD